MENGKTTVEKKENGKVISRLVNGEETLAIASGPDHKESELEYKLESESQHKSKQKYKYWQ